MWSNCILRQSLHLLQVPKIVSCSLCFPQPLFIPPETVGSVPGSLLQSSPAPATVSWLMLTWSLLNPKTLCVCLSGLLVQLTAQRAGIICRIFAIKKSPKRPQHHKHGREVKISDWNYLRNCHVLDFV